jgi:glycosyltransferase involved in cell wall biosynthesis
MIKKGLKQAKKFSWEKNARETLEVYEELCTNLVN